MSVLVPPPNGAQSGGPLDDTKANGETVLEADSRSLNVEKPDQDQEKAESECTPQDLDVEKQPATEAEGPHHAALAKENYTVFTVPQIRGIVIAGSFIGLLSPMTGAIYFPALTKIAHELHTTDSRINITVTTYLIIQGLAPMMIAGFSDKAGRRPAYFICFIIYIIANLALALQNNYIALLLLRMLQSGGSSGTIALAQALVGDCVVSAERGQYIAYASVGTLLGPSLSPILGGVISTYAGWHWIFWFLLIFSIAAFIPMALFLPETGRGVVGDASVPPPWSSKNVSDHIRFKNREKKGIPVNQEKLAELRKNYRITIPNPLKTLIVFADLESSLILLANGLIMAVYYAISTGASQNFSTVYGFSDLYVSLMFLPLGAGGIVATFTTGKLIDMNYQRHARRLGFPVDRRRQADLTTFPIELARLQIGLPILLTGAAAVIGYGWLLGHKVSLAGPAIMLFVLGYSLTAGFQSLNILMVDIYPGRAATATAANNVVRCLLGAAASAAIVPMSEAMGYGPAYTVLAVFVVLGSLGAVLCMKYGMKWRQAKKRKAEEKKKAKEEAARDEKAQAGP